MIYYEKFIFQLNFEFAVVVGWLDGWMDRRVNDKEIDFN